MQEFPHLNTLEDNGLAMLNFKHPFYTVDSVQQTFGRGLQCLFQLTLIPGRVIDLVLMHLGFQLSQSCRG